MTLRPLDSADVRHLVEAGARLIDMRPIDQYLGGHALGSISMLFENGPGFGGRARDLLPLDSLLILLEDDLTPAVEAAAALRGKGFRVDGYLPGGVVRYKALESDLASTESIDLQARPPELALLDVGDAGSHPPDTATRIPAESLVSRGRELDPSVHWGVLAGSGVRAAAAIGILESLGFEHLTYVRS